MSALHEDWLACWAPLRNRIREQVPELRAVYDASGLDALDKPDDTQAAAVPAAHVFYVGDRLVAGPDGARSEGARQAMDQIWGVGLLVRNGRGAQAAAQDAGLLIPKVIRAVAGWDPQLAGIRPFRRAPITTAARFYTNGKAIFPLFFSTRVFA